MFFKKKKESEIIEENNQQPNENINSLNENDVISEEKKSEFLAPATASLDKELRKEFEDFKIKKVLHRIDLTCLGREVTREVLKKACKDAENYGFYSVLVNPVNIPITSDYLSEDSKVKISCAISYPLGEDTTKVKVYQAKQAVLKGADEIDLVASVSAVKRGDYRYFKKEIIKVVKAVKKTPVKVIIETSALTSGEIERAAKNAAETNATFIETCTGFYGEGAKESDVRAIRKVVGADISIKASGGINNCHDCMAMLEAGADRIGTENGAAIAEGLIRGE